MPPRPPLTGGSTASLSEEAQSVFYDEFAIQYFDDEHDETEDRFLMLGFSNEARLLIVCHCEREHGHIIRIISARKATKGEGAHYRKVNK